MKQLLLLSVLLLLTACRENPATPAPAPPPDITYSPWADIDTVTFRLLSDSSGHRLFYQKTRQNWPIPQSLLSLPDSLKEADTEFDDPGSFYPGVQVFDLGEGLLGLHLSSYDIASGGSMALASGADLFLVLDTVRQIILPGVLHFGITKGRHKAVGSMEAEYARFYISRPPGSRFAAIGIWREKIYVHRDPDTGAASGGPYFEAGPMQWYVFDGARWRYHPGLERYLPIGKGSGELPPVGLAMTPLDVARDFYRRR